MILKFVATNIRPSLLMHIGMWFRLDYACLRGTTLAITDGYALAEFEMERDGEGPDEVLIHRSVIAAAERTRTRRRGRGQVNRYELAPIYVKDGRCSVFARDGGEISHSVPTNIAWPQVEALFADMAPKALDAPAFGFQPKLLYAIAQAVGAKGIEFGVSSHDMAKALSVYPIGAQNGIGRILLMPMWRGIAREKS